MEKKKVEENHSTQLVSSRWIVSWRYNDKPFERYFTSLNKAAEFREQLYLHGQCASIHTTV